MEQQDYERWMLLLIGAGTMLAVIEFLVMSFVIGNGNIVALKNGFLAGAVLVVVVVVLVWLAANFLRPSEQVESKPAALDETVPKTQPHD